LERAVVVETFHGNAITLIHGDCLEVMPTLPDADLIFFDPPYGVNIAEWDRVFDAEKAAALCLAKLKPGASLYATCSLHILPEMMRLLPYRRIITWCKPNLPLRKNLNEWEWSTEYILWITRGEPKTFHKPQGEDARDYWRIPLENGFLRNDDFNHPARKPEALLRRILLTSTDSGDTVIDPMFGSCTTGAACASTGRICYAIERNAGYFSDGCRRIAGTLYIKHKETRLHQSAFLSASLEIAS
jgi:DNA modification methylase